MKRNNMLIRSMLIVAASLSITVGVRHNPVDVPYNTFAQPVAVAQAAEVDYLGDNQYWYAVGYNNAEEATVFVKILDDEKTLVVYGEGEMQTDCSRCLTEKEISKIEKVVIASGVTKVADEAFYCIPNIKEIEIADTVQEIGERAFAFNIRDYESLYNGKYMTSDKYTPITSIKWSKGLKTIKESAFEGRVFKMNKLTFPEGLKVIEKNAFKSNIACNLKKVVLPKSVEKVENFGLFFNETYKGDYDVETLVIKGDKLTKLEDINAGVWICKKGSKIADYAKKNKCLYMVSSTSKPVLSSNSKGKVTVKINAVAGSSYNKGVVDKVSCYQIKYSYNKDMSNAKSIYVTTLSKEIAGLKSGKTIHIQVRACDKLKWGDHSTFKAYNNFSDIVAIKIK